MMRKIWTLGMAVVATVAGAAPLGAATVTRTTTITSVTPGPRSITVGYKQGTDENGRPIFVKITCTSSNGGLTKLQEGFVTPLKLTGLSAGRTYTCRVAVAMPNGLFGPASPPSAPVVPQAEQKTHVPDPPALVYVHPGKERISVGFKQLDHSGGLKVTRYVARCVSSNGGHSNKQQGSISPVIVDHLTAAKTYTCRVAARNALGFGAYGAASKPVVTTS